MEELQLCLEELEESIDLQKQAEKVIGILLIILHALNCGDCKYCRNQGFNKSGWFFYFRLSYIWTVLLLQPCIVSDLSFWSIQNQCHHTQELMTKT